MTIGSSKGWVKYLSNIRSPRSMKVLDKARNRIARKSDWSYSRRQSLGSLYSRELQNKPTPAELMFGNYLVELGIFPFNFQKQILKPNFYILDFYLPKMFVAFEIDGSSHDLRKDKDKLRDKVLMFERNIKTYRFTNEQVFNNPTEVKNRIRQALIWQ